VTLLGIGSVVQETRLLQRYASLRSFESQLLLARIHIVYGVKLVTSNGRWRLSSLSSVGVCNTRICNVTHQGQQATAARDGGPVVLRLVRRHLVTFAIS